MKLYKLYVDYYGYLFEYDDDEPFTIIGACISTSWPAITNCYRFVHYVPMKSPLTKRSHGFRLEYPDWYI